MDRRASTGDRTRCTVSSAMRVFLAGATGVIGTPLVPQLLAAGHHVTALTRSVLRAAQLEAVGADPVVCDVFDADRVRAAMTHASPEAVLHQLTALPARLDWADPGMFDPNNRVRTEGTRILLDAAVASGARRIVAQSIAFVYAPTGDRVKDESAALFTDAPARLHGGRHHRGSHATRRRRHRCLQLAARRGRRVRGRRGARARRAGDLQH